MNKIDRFLAMFSKSTQISYRSHLRNFFKAIDANPETYFDEEKLIGVDLIDILENGISSIYFYYDPQFAHYSLGRLSLYNQIKYAKNLGIEHPEKFSKKELSKLIDANDLMSMGSSESNSAEDSVATEVVIVPKNIDFVLSSKTDKILYDKLTITNTKGKVTIRDGRVILDGLNMALLDGAMNLTGQYSTEDINKPFVDFDIKATNIDINRAAYSFSVVDSIVPIAKNAKGKVSAGFKYYSLLGEDSSPIMSSVSGGGNLKSKGIEISG